MTTSPSQPRIFIGSSKESLPLAHALHNNLSPTAISTPWDKGLFPASEFSLASLVKALDDFDFAALVFAADDVVRMRKTQHLAARDNVVFELGLFIGRMGIPSLPT